MVLVTFVTFTYAARSVEGKCARLWEEGGARGDVLDARRRRAPRLGARTDWRRCLRDWTQRVTSAHAERLARAMFLSGVTIIAFTPRFSAFAKRRRATQVNGCVLRSGAAILGALPDGADWADWDNARLRREWYGEDAAKVD